MSIITAQITTATGVDPLPGLVESEDETRIVCWVGHGSDVQRRTLYKSAGAVAVPELTDAEVSELQAAVASLGADLATAQGQISALESDLATAQGQIATLQGQVTALDSRVTALEQP